MIQKSIEIMLVVASLLVTSSSFWSMTSSAYALPVELDNTQPNSNSQLDSSPWLLMNTNDFESYPEEVLTRSRRDASSQKSPSDKKSKSFESNCLRAHNKWRKLHQAPELVFDKKIAAFAQKRANFIAESDGSEFKHPPDLPFGENLAWHSRATQSCAELIKLWYDEVELYDFNRGQFDHETGHFTQLVWRDSKKVGCAKAVSSGPKGGVYLVCNYDPPGNFLGEGLDNVLRRALLPAQRPTETTTETIATTAAAVTVTTPPPTTTMIITTTRSPTPTVAAITTATATTTATPIPDELSSSATTAANKKANKKNKKKNSNKDSNGKRKKGNKNKKNKKKRRNNKNKKQNLESSLTNSTAIPLIPETTTTTTISPTTLAAIQNTASTFSSV